MENGGLTEYNKKRNFNNTGEPAGRIGISNTKPVFVVQKHDASRLHYDFRIECGGILLSWAVPKGPSMDPSVRRLAIQTEDHPMAYADFEGTIPEGEYGAGSVIVWDKGVYQNISEKNGKQIYVEEALEKGHISLVIAGRKLKGGFNMVRIKQGRNPQWLLMKMEDPYAEKGSKITVLLPNSIITGLPLEKS